MFSFALSQWDDAKDHFPYHHLSFHFLGNCQARFFSRPSVSIFPSRFICISSLCRTDVGNGRDLPKPAVAGAVELARGETPGHGRPALFLSPGRGDAGRFQTSVPSLFAAPRRGLGDYFGLLFPGLRPALILLPPLRGSALQALPPTAPAIRPAAVIARPASFPGPASVSLSRLRRDSFLHLFYFSASISGAGAESSVFQ